MKICLRLLSVLLLLGLIAGGVCFYLLNDAIKPLSTDGNAKPQVVEIVPGATASEVGRDLEKRGLIRSAFAFKLLVRYGKKSDQLKVGHYELSSNQSPLTMLEILVKGKSMTKKITFPEGLTIKESAEVVRKSGLCDADEFLELVSKHGSEFGNFPDNLEGYLLPDTYQVPWVCSSKELVSIMTARFDELARPMWDKTSPEPFAQTIVLASLVEREVQVPSERPIVAGVYVNRLKDGMLLECDATIQYALGKQKEFLLFSDLEIDSPFNTYKRPGLPPSPICSPGLEAIKAACHPTYTDYYFYVRNDVKGDGSHVFSKNFTEHNQAIHRYQSQ